MQDDQCILCIRYLGNWQCDAYPEGIPDPIILGEHDHTEPFMNDQGIRFKRIPKKAIEESKRGQ